MTSLSPETLSPSGSATDPERRLSRAIAWARASLGIENFIPGLWPALGFAGAYISLSLFGLFAFIPWALQALLLAATITAVGLSLESGLGNFSWPRWRDGARRLEQDSGLKHRPISEIHDSIIGDDPFALELWRQHQARRIAFGKLRVRLPAPDIQVRDPKYLRYGVILLLAGGLVLAGSQWRERMMRAFDSGAGLLVTLDAWVDPPAYTGLPPVYLAPDDTNVIAVPKGSTLNLRAHNAPRAPGLQIGISVTSPPRFTGQNGEYSNTAKIISDGRVRVRSSGHTIGNWHLRAIADAVPVINFDGVPSATEHQATKISFRTSDDYGVTGAKLVIVPHGRPGPPLTVDLPIAPSKSITQTNYNDLTPHPYAGLTVDAHLEARDGAGQIGKSKTVSFRLPARVFTDPLARALIEQRQNVATSDANGKRQVAATLEALTIAPEKFYQNATNVYMGIRSAYWGLRHARAPEDITHVEELLWQIAVSLEQKGLLDAAADLRRLQSEINQALAMHAPQEVIDQLLNKYNEAMQRYMQALANNPDAQAQAQQQMQGQDSKTLTQKDLEDLLKAIQQMSAAGNREQAAQMMAMLQSLLENLKMAKNGQGGQGQQNKALNDAIQKFGDMMGQQRGLMDKTMRQKNGNGDPKDGGTEGLARQQGALKKQLDETMKGLDPKLGSKLGPAGQAMQRAQNALGQKNLDNAGNEEKNALEALRQGAQALAQEAQKSQQGGGEENKDPLGRQRGAATNGVKIPGPGDLVRARDILRELRKRAGERGRPQQELDYYDRLLREF